MLLIVCVGIPISFRFALAQDAEIADGTATIRGDVVDTSPEQKPIAGAQVTITNTRLTGFVVRGPRASQC